LITQKREKRQQVSVSEVPVSKKRAEEAIHKKEKEAPKPMPTESLK